MGISDVDVRGFEGLVVPDQGLPIALVEQLTGCCQIERGGSHFHLVETKAIPSRLEADFPDSTAGLDKDGLSPEVMALEKMADTPDGVSAHLGFGAVDVEHLHPAVMLSVAGGHYEDDPVRSEAPSLVAQEADDLGLLEDPEILADLVEKNEMVAQAVHLEKFEHRNLLVYEGRNNRVKTR